VRPTNGFQAGHQSPPEPSPHRLRIDAVAI